MKRIFCAFLLVGTLVACGADGPPVTPSVGAGVRVGPGGVNVGGSVGANVGGVNVSIGI